MSSSAQWPEPEGPPPTADEVAALRRAGRPVGLDGVQYLKFLSQFRATAAQQRARKGPRGEPFRL